jgi:virulence-associated protein VapD
MMRVYIDKSFAFHMPSDDGLQKITRIQQAYSDVKRVLETEAPSSRQLSVALTELETSAMWAIKAVVFNDPKSEVA